MYIVGKIIGNGVPEIMNSILLAPEHGIAHFACTSDDTVYITDVNGKCVLCKNVTFCSSLEEALDAARKEASQEAKT